VLHFAGDVRRLYVCRRPVQVRSLILRLSRRRRHVRRAC
jgi:hypothetical protein